jgi:sulfopyruvate decarboxylase TPP-binding subunit
MNQFRCQNCGSNELAYVKYVRHLIPVEYQNGTYVYSESEYHEDIESDIPRGYCCGECGQMLQLHTLRIRTETELLKYIHYFSPEKRIS